VEAGGLALYRIAIPTGFFALTGTDAFGASGERRGDISSSLEIAISVIASSSGVGRSSKR
jgi:hypothetical protein